MSDHKLPLSRRIQLFIQRITWKFTELKNLSYDALLGIETNRSLREVNYDPSLFQDMYGYQASAYGVIEKALACIKLKPNDVFIDFGCGKGRVVIWTGLHRLKKVIGVEIDAKLSAMARNNIKKARFRRTPAEIINQDAAEFDPDEGTVFFFFNPFGAKTISAILAKIKNSLITNPREIRIIYYSAMHREVFESQNWLVLKKQVKPTPCLIWSNK